MNARTGPWTKVALTVMAVLTLAPFVWMVISSLKTFAETMTMPPTLLPDNPTLDNFVTVTERIPFFTLLWNTIVVSAAEVVLTVIIASLAAYALSILDLPGKGIILVALLAVMMVPGEIFMIPQYQIIAALGLTDTLTALILPSVFSVFGAFLMVQTFTSIPKEMVEAARLDGAGHFTTFFRIVLPNAKGGMTALAVITLLGSWTSLLWPIVVNRSMDKFTLGPGLAMLRGSFFTESNIMMAAGVMAAIPMILFFLLIQKQFIQGITQSGMK
ncbi:MAG: carbohydrate ABC transporter permease [Propionibacteriaceae bacterium]|nr:carbohydrate ABC transporter permease [Propionibacteriaceae bacterium]